MVPPAAGSRSGKSEIQSIAARPYGRGFVYCKSHANGRVCVGFATIKSAAGGSEELQVGWEAAAQVPGVLADGWCGADVSVVESETDVRFVVAAVHANSSRAAAGFVVQSPTAPSGPRGEASRHATLPSSGAGAEGPQAEGDPKACSTV